MSRMNTSLVIGNRNYSSWSLRAWLLLAESGIDFDEHRIPMDTPEFRGEALRYSPTGRVPVLVLGDEHVWDTLAIAETVAERWPEKHLWPSAPEARAFARSICAEMHSGFAELREAMPMNCRAMGRQVPIGAALQTDIDRVIDIWARCQADFGGEDDWLFGHFTVADAMFAPVVLRFRTYGVNVPASASRYPKRLLESRALQQWLLASESETEVIDGEEKGQ
jgi:glutathione S-transferase